MISCNRCTDLLTHRSVRLGRAHSLKTHHQPSNSAGYTSTSSNSISWLRASTPRSGPPAKELAPHYQKWNPSIMSDSLAEIHDQRGIPSRPSTPTAAAHSAEATTTSTNLLKAPTVSSLNIPNKRNSKNSYHKVKQFSNLRMRDINSTSNKWRNLK